MLTILSSFSGGSRKLGKRRVHPFFNLAIVVHLQSMVVQGFLVGQWFLVRKAPNKVLKPNLHLRSTQRMASPLYALCYTLGSVGLARRYVPGEMLC